MTSRQAAIFMSVRWDSNHSGPMSTRSRLECRTLTRKWSLHDDPEIPRDCNVHYLVDDVVVAVQKLVSAGFTLGMFGSCFASCLAISRTPPCSRPSMLRTLHAMSARERLAVRGGVPRACGQISVAQERRAYLIL